jgi:hypothetical protein
VGYFAERNIHSLWVTLGEKKRISGALEKRFLAIIDPSRFWRMG